MTKGGVALAVLLLLQACSSSGGSQGAGSADATAGGAGATAATAGADATAATAGAACNLAGFLAVQHAHVNHAEVTLCGTVARVRPIRRTRSGVHRVFFVDVGGGDSIAIDANVDIMGNFPVTTGEATTVRGEYYYDEDGREGVHWTHRTYRGSHPPGYVILDGRQYD